ncbi:MAG: hypothetical protein WC997_02340 [Porticoccaceae bacterium]
MPVVLLAIDLAVAVQALKPGQSEPSDVGARDDLEVMVWAAVE